jgi:nucleotide-binding universal stress UspA family protein
MKVKKILVPTDFSDHSMQALKHAIDLGKRFKAGIIVFHCLEPIYLAAPADLYGTPANLTTLMSEERHSAKQRLERIERDLKKRRIPIRTVLGSGTPHLVIVEAVAKLGVDLIVMSTHGRSGFSHLLIGSVAERVVRAAPCPVLTIRGKVGRRRRKRG